MEQEPVHEFRCPHCEENVSIQGHLDDEDTLRFEQDHMMRCLRGPVHRRVDFEIKKLEFGDRACGTETGETTGMPSHVTCKKCLEITPSLQLRGMLEIISSPENADRVDAPEAVRAALRNIGSQLREEQTSGIPSTNAPITPE